MTNINIDNISKAGLIKNLILILVIIVLGKVLLSIISHLITKSFKGKMQKDGYRKVRIETLSKNLYSVVKFIVGFIIVMIILDMLGINTRSIIATAGIGGVAIAFGAQTLVKDIVTGTIIIVDDTFRVGDWIVAGGVEGTVESLGMRQTKIRDYDGSLHTIPNSQISTVQNSNAGPIRFDCNIYLSYDVTIKMAEELVKEVANRLKEDEELKDYIIEDVSIFGITDLGETSYLLRTTAMAVPGYQWALARKERLIIVEELNKRNIKTSTYQVSVVNERQVNEEI